MATHSEFLIAELIEWCDESRVDPSHCLVLSGVPSGIEVADIEDAVQTVKAFGRVRVRAEKYHSKLGSNLVLCECRHACRS